MFAELTFIHTRNGALPGVVFYQSRRCYNRDDIDGLIIAHKEDDGEVGGHDFVCSDEEEAWERLRKKAFQLYPECEIYDRRN